MKMMKVTALKPHKYGTRHLTAGEEYEAPIREAVALVASKKARFADKAKRRAPDKPAEPEPQREPEREAGETPESLDGLRVQATQLGINVDGRWGVHRLRSEIAQARR